MKIEILRGMSYSGKSTYAEQKEKEGWVVVSRDRIRIEMLGGEEALNNYFEGRMDFCLEEEITNKEHQILAKNIIKGKNIIIDNLNLKRKYVQEYVNIFNDLGVETTDVSLVDFQIEFDGVIKRRALRPEKRIDREVLEKQFEQFKSLDWDLSDFITRRVKDKDCWVPTRDRQKWHFTNFDVEPYRPKQGTQPAIIVDIDGTLAHRRVVNGMLRSFYDYDSALTDYPDPSLKWLLENICQKARIIIVSGRMDSSLMTLIAWLKDNIDIPYFETYMRKDGDKRSDDIVKYELFNQHIRNNYAVKFVLDDRNRVCAMWQELGIKVLNCGDLNEDF